MPIQPPTPDTISNLETQVWILSGLTAFLITVILSVFGYIVKIISDKLDSLVASNTDHNTKLATILEQIKTLFENSNEIKDKVEEHDKEINNIKINCAKKCKS